MSVIHNMLNRDELEHNRERIQKIQDLVKKLCPDKDICEAISLLTIAAMQLAYFNMEHKDMHPHKCMVTRNIFECFIKNGEELKKLYDSLPNDEEGFKH